jgi:excinuclease ABC subunit B
MEIRPFKGQIDGLLAEIRDRAKKDQRVSSPPNQVYGRGPRQLLHRSRRPLPLHALRNRHPLTQSPPQGEYDALTGINFHSEGLDLPEVSLVAIDDGDKEAPSVPEAHSSRP